jgi:hypothetical protein
MKWQGVCVFAGMMQAQMQAGLIRLSSTKLLPYMKALSDYRLYPGSLPSLI